MADQYNLSAPGTSIATISPSDTAYLTPRPRYLIIGSAGNVALQGDNEATVTIACTAGQVLPFSPVRVMAAGTTASGILGAW